MSHERDVHASPIVLAGDRQGVRRRADAATIRNSAAVPASPRLRIGASVPRPSGCLSDLPVRRPVTLFFSDPETPMPVSVPLPGCAATTREAVLGPRTRVRNGSRCHALGHEPSGAVQSCRRANARESCVRAPCGCRVIRQLGAISVVAGARFRSGQRFAGADRARPGDPSRHGHHLSGQRPGWARHALRRGYALDAGFDRL